MSVTILEVIINAKYNLETFSKMNGGIDNPIFQMAMSQLNNALKSIELDKKLDDDFDGDILEGE